jgi:hypothetical protein
MICDGAVPALPPVPAPPAPDARAKKSFLKLRRKIRAAQQKVLEDRAASIVRREIGAIEKELKQLRSAPGRSRRDLDTLKRAIEEFYATHGAWSAERMRPILAAYSELIDGAIAQELDRDLDAETPPLLERFVRDYAAAFGKREASEGRLQLLALIDENAEAGEEEVAAALQQRLDEWGDKRAGKIGAAESVRFMGGAAKVLYVAAGVTVLRWAANPGACAFCMALDGKVAGVEGLFVAAGQGVDGGADAGAPLVPSDNIGHGPLHNGCFCDVVAA